jgi:dolichol kinase
MDRTSGVRSAEPASAGNGGSPFPVETDAAPTPARAPTAKRSDLQLGRRFFHLANGVAIATAYALLFTHTQVVHLFGTIACLVYILDRVRIHYPELLGRAPWVNDRFFRAEEHLRESAMTPYAIAILLTILTFPKPVALTAIYTLAVADPLSAVVGIRFGRHRVVAGKSLEGSGAFFAATAAIAFSVLTWAVPGAPAAGRFEASLAVGLLGALCESLPIRLDDNLTIPLAVGFLGWLACAAFGVPV